MKIQEHIDKITWSLADKFIYFGYFFVTLFQIRAMEVAEYGIFALFINLYSWIFSISDALSLQIIIQFGVKESERRKVNLVALILFITIAMSSSLIIYFTKIPISVLLNENRFIHAANILPLLTLLIIPRIFTLKLILRDRIFWQVFLVDFSYYGTMTVMTFYYIYIQTVISFFDLINIYAIGAVFSSLMGIILTWKKLNFGIKGNYKLKDFLKFSFPLTLYSTLNTMPKFMDIYIIQYFFSLQTIGIYQSAKNLYRFFDDINNTAGGLVYPASVRAINHNNTKGLNDLITKAVSFTLIGFFIIFILLESGLGEFFIGLILPAKYSLAIPQFNLLIVASLPLPFTLLISIITAKGYPQIVFKYVLLSSCIWILAFIFIGILGNDMLIPLGVIVYTFSLATLCYLYAYRNLDFQPKQIFRAFKDSYYFVVNKFNNQ